MFRMQTSSNSSVSRPLIWITSAAKSCADKTQRHKQSGGSWAVSLRRSNSQGGVVSTPLQKHNYEVNATAAMRENCLVFSCRQ